MTILTAQLSLDEYLTQYAQQGAFEWLDGRKQVCMPSMAEHSEIIKRLYGLLLAYELVRQSIAAYVETPFVALYDNKWVRRALIPDVMVYRASRLNDYKREMQDWRHKPFVLVPDLCVEVVSPSDSYSDVEEKVSRYIEEGVGLVWVVIPRPRSVRVYKREDLNGTRYDKDDLLTAPELLPDFSAALSDIFPQ